jgi:hypothetical protein
MKKISKLFFDSPARYLVLVALILHLALVLTLYSIGRFAVFPRQVDEHGTLIAVLPDGITYQGQAATAVVILTHGGIRPWLGVRFDAHVKLYSLSFLVLGPLLGNNILSAEPFNLGCYLAILILVFKFGREVFDERVGRAAAGVVSVWPSFLVDTVQILKDPICVLAMLVLMLMMAFWLTRKLSWRNGLITGLIGATAIGLILATRAGFWVPVILGLVLIGGSLLVVRQVRERSLLAGNVLSMVMMLLLSVANLFLAEDFFDAKKSRLPNTPAVQASQDTQASAPVAQSSPPENIYNQVFPLHSPPERTNYFVIKVQQVRDSFAYRYKDSGTLIDHDIEFISVADVVGYLPRAMEIGFLAPFPNKWLGPGKEVGLAGRLISGGEMLAAYILEFFALVGLWRSRYRLSTWLLAGATMFGVTTLGLGLINVGALYRLRYGFFVLLIMLGMNGLVQISSRVHNSKVA